MNPEPTSAEIYALWRESWPERLPDERGFQQRLRAGEAIWRRDERGELRALVLCRPPEAHPYAYLRLLLVHPQWQRRGTGRELVRDVRRKLGTVPIAVGEESGHFVPGSPEELLPFWEGAGFRRTGGVCVDMRRDLRGELPAPVLPVGWRLTTGLEAGVLNGVLTLTREVFSPRWAADVQAVALVAPQQVLALLNAEQVVGFALTGVQSDPRVLPSFLYPQALTSGFDSLNTGGLGPIGLHPGVRGQGLGRAFILACMHHLKGRGIQLVGIDWTGIAPFYQKLGFQTWAIHHHLRG